MDRAPFEKIVKDGVEMDYKYCGDCVNFHPLWKGADRGDCNIMNAMVFNNWCCSCPDEYESIFGKQLNLF